MEIQERNLQKEEKVVRYTHINSGAPSVCIMFSGADTTIIIHCFTTLR